MTTMTNTILNNSYWNNIPSDQTLDIDDLFSSAFDFTHNQEYDQDSTLIEEDYQETSSSDVDTFSIYIYLVFIIFNLDRFIYGYFAKRISNA